MRPISPLRYPGGKGGLSGFLADLLELNNLVGCSYFEPYAGGAGAGLNLLALDLVKEVHINDADPRIYALWQAILTNNSRFVDAVLTTPLDLNEWRRQQEICAAPSQHDAFDVGFAAFYMNRCNRSGVLKGAGPIGGYTQDGKWRLDVRFNRESLAARIQALGILRDRIKVTGLDAIDFLKNQLPTGRGRARAFVYADPPYVIKGQKLYLNAYEPRDHADVAKYFLRQRALPWLISYDNTPLVQSLYSTQQIQSLPIRYSLQSKRAAEELLIAPPWLYLPSSRRNVRISELAG
jgi:DNA adenine methylase